MPFEPSGPPQPVQSHRYPPIGDYGLLSDCASTALVGRDGSIDWCCMPQMDADSCFGRLLDWDRGGHCRIAPSTHRGSNEASTSQRAYAGDSMLLATRFTTPSGSAVLQDFFAMRGDPARHRASDHLARLATCEAGSVSLRVDVVPRFDFGMVLPDVRQVRPRLYTACGGDKGLLIHCSHALEVDARHGSLGAEVSLQEGETLQLSIRFVAPEALSEAVERWEPANGDLVGRRDETLAWWAAWPHGPDGQAANGQPAPHDALTRRSALVLKSLCLERTGAIAAAATTSLPESPGGQRNWDYRYSWIRDSVLAVRALHALGHEREAERFSNFIERSAAGDARQLQLMYGLDGRRRLTEQTLDGLEGWRGAKPVRVGNAAAGQSQLDVYGSLLELAWLWHDASRPIDAEYWNFLVDCVDTTCKRWQESDHGIWEMRDTPSHFVHSKVMCWVAVDRGIRLAQRHGLEAPTAEWERAMAAMREEIDREGYDSRLGVYRQSYGKTEADAALLLLPHFNYLPFDDPRMLRTTDWLRQELEVNGLLLRYNHPDGLPDPEGAFLPCSFWLVECLARQGRQEEAHACYERTLACANDLGLFSEEFERDGSGMLGNFPQAFTHLAQITAKLALDGHEPTLGLD